MKKTIVYTIVGMASPALSLLLLPIYLKYLTTSEFAILSISNSFIAIFSVILSLKVDQALRTVYFYYTNDSAKQIALFRNLFSLQLVSFLMWTLILFFFGDLLFGVIYKNKLPFYPYTFIVLIGYFFAAMNAFYFIYLQNKLNVNKYSFLMILNVVLTHLLQLSCVYWFDYGFIGYLYSGLFANLFVFLLIVISDMTLFKIEFSKPLLKEALKFSLPFIPFLILYSVENQLDKFFIVRFLTLETLARYTVLLNISAIVMLLMNSLDNAIRPELFTLLSSQVENKTRDISKKLEFYLAISLLALSFLVAFGTHIHWFLNQPKYNGIAVYFPWIAIAFVPLLLLRFLALVLIYENKTKKINLFSTLKIGLLCLLFLVLIPKLQIVGAIITIGISNLLNVLVFYKILDTRIIIPKKIQLALIFFVGINCLIIIFYTSKMVSSLAFGQFLFLLAFILNQYWSDIKKGIYQYK